MSGKHRISVFTVMCICLLETSARAYNEPPVAIMEPNPDCFPLAAFATQNMYFGGGTSYDPDNGMYCCGSGITSYYWSFWPYPVSGSVIYTAPTHQGMYCKYPSVGKYYVWLEVEDDDSPSAWSDPVQCNVWIFAMDLDLPSNPTGCIGIGDTTQLSLGYSPSDLYAGHKYLSVNAGGIIKVLQDGNPVISGWSDLEETWQLRSSSDPSTLTIEGVSPGQVTLLLEYTADGSSFVGWPYNGDSVTVTVVGVHQIETYPSATYGWCNVTDSTITVLKGAKYQFRASHLPSAADWPNGWPVWTYDGSQVGSAGDDQVWVAFDSAGTKTLTVKCGSGDTGKTVTVNVVAPVVSQISV